MMQKPNKNRWESVHGSHWRRRLSLWGWAGLFGLLSAGALALPRSAEQPGSGWSPARSAVEILRGHLEAGRIDAALNVASGLSLEGESPQLRAEAHRMLGYAYARSGDYDQARRHYRSVLAESDVLDPAMVPRVHYTIAQLDFALSDFPAARRHLEAWRTLAGAAAADPAPHILLGQTCFQTGDHPGAIESLEAGIRRAEARGEEVPEHWLRLLHASYVETDAWPRVIAVLERLNARFPSPEYEALLAAARDRG